MPKKPTVINRKKSRAYFVLSQMPPLNRDQVSAWLLGRPELWDWIFEKARAMDVIRYENGIWVGVNHEVGVPPLETRKLQIEP